MVHLQSKNLITLKWSWQQFIVAVFGNLRPCREEQILRRADSMKRTTLCNLVLFSFFLFLCFWHLLLCNLCFKFSSSPSREKAKVSATRCRLWNILRLHICQGALPHGADLHANCHCMAKSITQSTRPSGLKCGTLIHDLQKATVPTSEIRFTGKELLCGGVQCD